MVTKTIQESNPIEQKSIAKGNKHNYIKLKIRGQIIKYITENNLLSKLYNVYLNILETKLQSELKEKRNTPYTDLNKFQTSKIHYNRYADDWMNHSYVRTSKFSNWISRNDKRMATYLLKIRTINWKNPNN